MNHLLLHLRTPRAVGSFLGYRRLYSAFSRPEQPLSHVGVYVYHDVIAEQEEAALLSQLKRPLRRLRYQPSHFDSAIHTFRELRKSDWDETTNSVFRRLQDNVPESVCEGKQFSNEIHILDLHEDGEILPHVDSIKFVRRIPFSSRKLSSHPAGWACDQRDHAAHSCTDGLQDSGCREDERVREPVFMCLLDVASDLDIQTHSRSCFILAHSM